MHPIYNGTKYYIHILKMRTRDRARKDQSKSKTKTQEYTDDKQQFHVWHLGLGWNHVRSRGFESDTYPANPKQTLPLS